MLASCTHDNRQTWRIRKKNKEMGFASYYLWRILWVRTNFQNIHAYTNTGKQIVRVTTINKSLRIHSVGNNFFFFAVFFVLARREINGSWATECMPNVRMNKLEFYVVEKKKTMAWKRKINDAKKWHACIEDIFRKIFQHAVPKMKTANTPFQSTFTVAFLPTNTHTHTQNIPINYVNWHFYWIYLVHVFVYYCMPLSRP